MTPADTKAKAAAAQASAIGAPMLCAPGPVKGTTSVHLGQVLVIMPSLLPNAPERVRQVWEGRARCNATGRCPQCDGCIGFMESTAAVLHEDGCPLLVGPGLDRWVDRRGVRALIALATGQ